jgi:hypothetical protein
MPDPHCRTEPGKVKTLHGPAARSQVLTGERRSAGILPTFACRRIFQQTSVRHKRRADKRISLQSIRFSLPK